MIHIGHAVVAKGEELCSSERVPAFSTPFAIDAARGEYAGVEGARRTPREFEATRRFNALSLIHTPCTPDSHLIHTSFTPSSTPPSHPIHT